MDNEEEDLDEEQLRSFIIEAQRKRIEERRANLSDGDRMRLRIAAFANLSGTYLSIILALQMLFRASIDGVMPRHIRVNLVFVIIAVFFLAELVALIVLPQRARWQLLIVIIVGVCIFFIGIVGAIPNADSVGLLIAILPSIKFSTWTQEWLESLGVKNNALWIQWRTLP
jgi:hypothetical protein